jgi:transposase InsO family protein
MKKFDENELALFRYNLISPIIHNTFTDDSVEQYVQRMSLEERVFPCGKKAIVRPGTIKAWLSLYRKNGYPGLLPKGRSDKGNTRKLSAEIRHEIFGRKQKRPKRTAKSIYDELIMLGMIQQHALSLSTVQRYVNTIRPQINSLHTEDMKAFEMEFANDLWQIDTSHGPILTEGKKKHQTYIIMIVDDASRLIMGHGIFLNDNALNVQIILKEALRKYGIPKRIYTDNGGPYRNKQLEIICATLGVGLKRAAVYHGNQKGKVERNFKSVKEGWMYNIEYADFPSIEAFNQSLGQYVIQKNQTEHRSIQTTPWLRFIKDQKYIRRLDAELIEQAFYHSVTRKVAQDATISLHTKAYETAMAQVAQAGTKEAFLNNRYKDVRSMRRAAMR